MISRDTVHDWLRVAREAVDQSSWAPVLYRQGLNVFDAYIGPLHLSALEGARRGGTFVSARNNVIDKVVDGLKWRYRDKVWEQFYLDRKARVFSANVTRASVVFWPVEPTHIKQQLPVARELQRMAVKHVFVTCRPGIFEMLRTNGERPIYSRAAWARPLIGARDKGTRDSLELAASTLIPLPPFPYSSDPEFGARCLQRALVSGMPTVYEAAATTERILNTISPQVLVVGNDITPEGRTASLAAKSYSLPTVSIMHGSVTGEPLDGEHIVDQFQVFGEIPRGDLERRGVESSRIEICGAPYLERVPMQNGSVHPNIKRRLGLSDHRAMVLLATSGPGHCTSEQHLWRLIESVMELSARMTNVDFVAKLHRKDRREFYAQPLRNVPHSRLHIVNDGAAGFPLGIFDWLQGCSILLTTTSTVATEAMLMNVPVVTMDFAGEYHGVDFIDAKATIHVRDEVALERAILDLLQKSWPVSQVKERAQEFLKRSFCAPRDEAALRSAEAICRIMNGKAVGLSRSRLCNPTILALPNAVNRRMGA